MKKGAKVYVEGQLQTRKWQDQSGAERYSTEVVLQNFGGTLTMLDGRAGAGGMAEGGQSDYGSGGGGDSYGGGSSAGSSGGGSSGGGYSAPRSAPKGGAKPAGGFDKALDDEIPF